MGIEKRNKTEKLTQDSEGGGEQWNQHQRNQLQQQNDSSLDGNGTHLWFHSNDILFFHGTTKGKQKVAVKRAAT